jgi:hypothetical protein
MRFIIEVREDADHQPAGRGRHAKRTVTDGPFTETKELIGGLSRAALPTPDGLASSNGRLPSTGVDCTRRAGP